uniref:G-protein coupled receptors family 1 profile domain-containing protein n=1 Tax=Hucho hucho TaxID=62062 RepID=A0A4W5K3N5_9TELE
PISLCTCLSFCLSACLHVYLSVFLSVPGDPCPQPSQVTASELHPCTNATKLNYFDDGSKAGFGILVICLFLFPVVSFLMALVVAYFRKSKFKKFQKAGANDTTKEPAAGITGVCCMSGVCVVLCDVSGWVLCQDGYCVRL